MERLLFECAIRSTLIAVAAMAVLSAARIKNVVARHNACTSVLVFMLALPLVVTLGYAVPLRILPPLHTEQVEPSSAGKIAFIIPHIDSALSESSRDETKPGHLPWMQWVEGIYFFGVGVMLFRVITGAIGAHRVKRQAQQLDGHLTSTSCSSPITVGWMHAVTILPEGWQDWETAKLDAVLIHENEHARRHDPLIQWLALVNRAIFCFHPLAWWLERRLAALSEEACDLAVLERGHHAGDYCRYLLDVANSVATSRRRIHLLGMAMPGAYLPHRIQKMLKGGLAPKVSFLRICSATAVFFLLSVGLSTATLVRAESAKPATIGAEIIVQPPGSSVILAMTPNTMRLQIADQLRALSGVKAVAPVMIKFDHETGLIGVIYGIDSHFTEVTGGFHWREGGLFKAPDEIVVDDLWAASHSAKPGDTVSLLNYPLKVAGVVEHGQGARAYMSIDTMSNLTGQQIRAALFYLKLQSPNKINAVTEEIHHLLPGYEVHDVSLFTTSMPSAIQQGAAIGMPQAETARLTERPLISEAALQEPSPRPQGPQLSDEALLMPGPPILIARPLSAPPEEISPAPPQRTRFRGGNNASTIAPPQVLSATAPIYTDEAVTARIEGTVTLEASVDANGKATVLRIVKGLGYGLDERAIGAVIGSLRRPSGTDCRPLLL
jgi:hypothetical protein